ncbi:MAG: hypothetical protein IJN61_03890 [Clostridia bacterium]|nr:hypothetical protein [Clostridia bacterium]
MSNRILKESVCTSPTIESLSWFEEVCFYRLIVQCDDYGRMDARPSLLKARLFPLREDIESGTVEKAVEALAEAGLLLLYEAEGQPYLQLLTWEKHQRVRNKRSRFPAPYPQADGQAADD